MGHSAFRENINQSDCFEGRRSEYLCNACSTCARMRRRNEHRYAQLEPNPSHGFFSEIRELIARRLYWLDGKLSPVSGDHRSDDYSARAVISDACA